MRRAAPLLLLLLLASVPARAAMFTASDGTRLHFTVQGRPGGPTVVFIPGWLMPGWIFARTAAVLASRYRVVLFDPRGQGASAVPAGGYTAARRGQDIAELLARLGPRPVVLVAWSLGVLDTLAFLRAHADAQLAGLVLIDNSVGEPPPPVWHPSLGPVLSHAAAVAGFVRGMFHSPQPAGFLRRLTRAALRLPASQAAALRDYAVPRDVWRRTVERVRVPLLYVVRPWLAAQAAALRAARPGTAIALFPHAGHALFIDDAPRFDAILRRFLAGAAWR
ncbi:MAG: alpha/beta fold hydrolase [Acetobacteraceae bacterium]